MPKRKKRARPKKLKPATTPEVSASEALTSPAEPDVDPGSRKAAVATTAGQKLLLIAFGLALGAIVVLSLEGVMALFGLGESARYDDPFVGFEPGFDLFELEERPSGDVYRTRASKLAFFNLQEFPAEKSSDTYRIFTLGGSTTAGRPYDAEVAFGRWLELYLAEADPERRYEVINAGAISYASYRVALLMQELVRYEPDLFVIYTGHNEFLEERSYADLRDEDPRWRKLAARFGRLRSFTLAREGLRQLRGEQEVPGTLLASEVKTRLAGWTGLEAYHRDEDLSASIVEHFEFNLRRMIRIARDHGARLIFVEPVSNLKDFSPFKSQHSEDFDRRQEIRFDELLAEGRQALGAAMSETASEQEAASAVELLLELVRLDPAYAESHFRLGQAYVLLGRYDAAKRSLIAAKDLDVAPLRALEAIGERLRAVTAEAGVPLIDLPRILEDDCEARYGHRILGEEYLLDHVHPEIPVHSLIAERTIDVLSDQGSVRAAGSGTAAVRRRIYDRVVGSIDREYYARRDLNLAKVLGWSGKLEEAEAPLLRAKAVLEGELEVALNLGILYQKTGRPEEALGELEKAVKLAPTSPEAHFNLGVTRGLLGRVDAGTAALERALELRPDYSEARYNLGVLRRRRGDLEGALESFRAVLDERPDTAEVHRELGLLYRRQGRYEEAAGAFLRALELDPHDAVAATDLGITYGRQGRVAEALHELERAAALDPGYAEAHYNLGVVRAGRGETEEAVLAYRRALEANPAFVEAYNNLGILLAGRGELAEARRLLERATELRPDYAEAHLNLGVVYDQSGFRQQAILAIERAFELTPEDARIQQALRLLKEDS